MKLDVTTYDELRRMLRKCELFLGECALPNSKEIGVIVCPEQPSGQPQAIAVRITGIRYGNVQLETSDVCRDVEIWPLKEHPWREQASLLGWNERPQRQILAKEVEKFVEKAKRIFDTG